MLFSEFYPDHFTATILEWKHLLKQDKYKDIIISSLQFLVQVNRSKVYAFCIMSNHIHVIWQVQAGHHPKEVQLSFMKCTAQMIIKDLRNNHKEVLEKFKVKASDRTYQIWERNALSISLWDRAIFKQKPNYIHNNPVVAGLCSFPEEYKYSSASFRAFAAVLHLQIQLSKVLFLPLFVFLRHQYFCCSWYLLQ
jgi:REP element-mobilizing transposase RayT